MDVKNLDLYFAVDCDMLGAIEVATTFNDDDDNVMIVDDLIPDGRIEAQWLKHPGRQSEQVWIHTPARWLVSQQEG